MILPRIGKDQIADTYDVSIDGLDEERGFQEFEDDVLNTNNIFISTLAMDFPSNFPLKKRKAIDEVWKAQFVKLDHIKSLNLRHRVDQNYFEAVCEMRGLESLSIRMSSIENISSIVKLKGLKSLSLSNFSRLQDISPLRKMRNLEQLSILASFKISNYELIGKMAWLKSLEIGGDCTAPRNLILKSLEPYTNLNELVELDLSSSSIRDRTYRLILKLKKLQRLNAYWRMKEDERDHIINEHEALRSGFFVAYDFVKDEFKDGIEWWID
jgi:Leucine-rich repeat (LRR) protein